MHPGDLQALSLRSPVSVPRLALHKPLFLLLLLALTAVSGCASQPPWEKTNPEQRAEAYTRLGMGYLELGEYSRSLQEFDRALRLQPQHSRALHGMALTFQAQGETQLAEDYFQQVLQIETNNTAARNNYGAFLFEENRYDEAHSQLALASEDLHYVDRALVLENLGYVALAQNNEEAAQNYFQRSLRLESGQLNARRELLRLYLQKDDLSAADKQWKHLRPIGNKDPDLLKLGLELAKKTGNKREQEQLEQALSALQ